MPTQKTKFVMSKAQHTGRLRFHTPTPVMNRYRTIRPSTPSRHSAKAMATYQARGGRAASATPATAGGDRVQALARLARDQGGALPRIVEGVVDFDHVKFLVLSSVGTSRILSKKSHIQCSIVNTNSCTEFVHSRIRSFRILLSPSALFADLVTEFRLSSVMPSLSHS